MYEPYVEKWTSWHCVITGTDYITWYHRHFQSVGPFPGSSSWIEQYMLPPSIAYYTFEVFDSGSVKTGLAKVSYAYLLGNQWTLRFTISKGIMTTGACLSNTVAQCHSILLCVWAQTSIHRLETALGWASAEPIAFVMLMSLSRCTARHSGACRCAPIDFAYPRGSRFQPKQGSDSSRRARDTAATMLHFTHFWRHRGESAMKHCQLYNCTCKKCVYMNISDKNWPNNVEFRGNFHRFAPSTAGRQEIILTVELSNPKSTRATDWQIYATCIICVCSQNCGLLSTHNLLIIHMNEYTCTEFLWHFFHASNLMPKLWGQNHARISPMLATSARFQSGFGTLWRHVITY